MAFIQLTHAAWVERFRPITKPGSTDIGLCSHHDAELLRNSPPFTIWTMVSCPGNDWVIQNGFWRINRMEHYVTEVPYSELDEYNVE